MGSGAINIPTRLDTDLYHSLAGNRFSSEVFNAYAEKNNDGVLYLSRSRLFELNQKSDVYLMHHIGNDPDSKMNNSRVSAVNDCLKGQGLLTWFGEGKLYQFDFR